MLAQRGDPFDAVAEQRDHREVVADRQLTAMKDRARRDRVLLPASRAFPADRRLCQRIDLCYAAMRTERLPTIRGEPNALEHIERFLMGQPKNLSDAQTPCGFGEKEMLRHDAITGVTNAIEYGGNSNHCQQQK